VAKISGHSDFRNQRDCHDSHKHSGTVDEKITESRMASRDPKLHKLDASCEHQQKSANDSLPVSIAQAECHSRYQEDSEMFKKVWC